MPYLGLSPELIVERLWVWQLATYLFLHGGSIHILFNMLGIWMFGVELERLWGTRQFLKYYAITGIGAGLTVLAVGILLGSDSVHLPGDHDRGIGRALRPAGRVRVLLSRSPAADVLPVPDSGEVFRDDRRRDGVSVHAEPAACRKPRISAGWSSATCTCAAGRGGLSAELKYRYLKWKMNRLRRKFDVYSGGRSDWDRHVH